MMLSFENLSTRAPSPLADTLTAALLLALSDLLPAPHNFAGRAGAKVAVKDAISLIRLCLRKMPAKVDVLLIDSASWLTFTFPRHLTANLAGKTKIPTVEKA